MAIAHDGAFWVADSPEKFRRAIVNVLSHSAEAGARAAQARAVFDRMYSLQANMQALEKVIASATLNHARRPGTKPGTSRLAAAE